MISRIPILVAFLFFLPSVRLSTDFDNARIIGLPRLSCSKKSITFSFESNIPFQGRISVINKLFIPECNQDYSSNIQKNATFNLDISKCADPNFLRNGSRLLSAHMEIGFHPLVITNNDRIFQLECMDNTPSQVVNLASENANCTHLVRMASKWDSMTDFNVGDAIVHEWSCHLPNKDLGKTQTYLTNCNALSQNGQIIHLIDENGCIIDSELMGDVVYNNYMPKLYARAKIFKLLTDEKYRIECVLEFCHKDSPCRDRAYPPKCAFTREEIIKRFTEGSTDNEVQTNTMMPGNPNMGYDRKVKISTAWLTVRYNQYTTIETLHERYRLKTTLNPFISDEKSSAVDHFLMGISYRGPPKTSEEERHRTETNRIEAARILQPSGFQPILNPPIDSDEEFIESITIGSNKVESGGHLIGIPPIASHPTIGERKQTTSSPITVFSTSSSPTFSTTTISPTTSKLVTTTQTPTTRKMLFESKPWLISTTTKKTPTTSKIQFSVEKPEKREKVNGAGTSLQSPMFGVQNLTESLVQFKSTESTKSPSAPAAKLQFYTDDKTKKLTPTTPYVEPPTTTTTEEPQKTSLPFVVEETTFRESNIKLSARKPYDKFVNNNADWRLDERAINDSDVLPERQTAPCSNATIISTHQQCKWTGVEHLLLIWSFASLLVWMVMIAICFYRHSSRKPRWMAFREQELRRAAQARVLGQEHPWLHADAFEERNRSKNEVEINKF